MKWYTYIFCFLIIIVGFFCGIELYKDIKAESYINGSIDITNVLSQESFSYSSTSLVFYHDLYDETNTWYFENDLVKVNDFNGLENDYKLFLNDYLLLDTTYSAGSVSSVMNLELYDTNGDCKAELEMNISIKFLNDKTTLLITTNGEESAKYLEQYFADNGFKLKIEQVL